MFCLESVVRGERRELSISLPTQKHTQGDIHIEVQAMWSVVDRLADAYLAGFSIEKISNLSKNHSSLVCALETYDNLLKQVGIKPHNFRMRYL